MKINQSKIIIVIGLVFLGLILFIQIESPKFTLKNGQNTICTFIQVGGKNARITYKINTGEEFNEVIGNPRLSIEKGEKYQAKFDDTYGRFLRDIIVLYWSPVFDEKDCYTTKLAWIDVDDDDHHDGSNQKVFYGYEIGNQKFERIQRLKDMNLKNEDLDKLEVLYKKDNPKIAYLRKKGK